MRKGGTQLANIEIYHDFKWKSIFNDNKTHFRNGKALAVLVKKECPNGKIPALILTTSDETEELPIETTSHYAIIIKIHEYLNIAKADPAEVYFAHKYGKLTQATVLNEIAFDTATDININLHVINNWAKGSTERIKQLQQIIKKMKIVQQKK